MNPSASENDPSSSKISEALSKLIQTRLKTNPNRQALLEKFKSLIAEAREVGVSHQALAQTISEHGQKVTKHDLIAFCQKQLNEKKPKNRSKKKTDPSPSKSIQTHPLTSQTPATPHPPSSSGGHVVGISRRTEFRVARDEDL